MIGIRVDVNKTIATGHIMRDMAIALELRKQGEDCLFFSADAGCIPYLERYSFPYVLLHSDWNHLDEEIPLMCSLIQEKNISSLLIDTYYVTPEYMQALSRLTKVTYFDELNYQGYGCQQLINGVLEPPVYSSPNQQAFTGPAYVSLREEFSALPPKSIAPHIQKVLVTSGGTDNYHFSRQFLEAFLNREDLKDISLLLVIGSLCVDHDMLLATYGAHPRVKLYVNTNQMAQLMQEADYALTAGGTTLYEVCAAGVCSSSYVIADNQLEIVQSFDRKGLVSYSGDFRTAPAQTIETILEQIKNADSYQYRLEKARLLQSLVDGKGASRIAALLK